MPAGAYAGPLDTLRHRDGFALTDRRFDHRQTMDQVEYCIYCHQRDKDSCSKGLFEKDGSTKRNPVGITLHGCPLDEKISEMHLLKHHGDGLAALAVVMIDNPMCPGTGHRICNDCMKACIYQKQEPVNIPQIETHVLTEVLNYPFGFEIYSLLTRWNPLNVRRPHALPYNGKKVLVVGLGPAGYTLANYLINEGFGVIGVDGLKIEPLPEKFVGSKNSLPQPIASYREIYEELDDRILLGFGGVSEYGITVRWDKNFLKVVYITLARRSTFRIYDGVRFGGTITIDDAWKLGFDHIAIATGAGKPTIVSMKNNLIRGIRQASDFLMALQLTGAYKPHALANLQVRMPAVVIGGGLTGIDTATELMAYYPVQVERILMRSETLIADLGEEKFWSTFTDEEKEIMNEFIGHGRAVRSERERAAAENRAPNFLDLVRSWGGVSLVYRKTMNDAPAYRLNHEEIIKALEEGIYFIENLAPVEAVPDRHGAVEAMVFERQGLDENGKWRSTGEQITLPARSVMIAAGTSPNTIIDREKPTGEFEYDQWKQFFAPYMVQQPVAETAVAEAVS
jgi:NADPH-dependent glutamate synthase beta subunit-like oxidoreductase